MGLDRFIELFKGREDCMGLQSFCLKEPLTKEIYQSHIDGHKRIGVYPIFDNKFVRWIACDIDDNDFNKIRNISVQARHYGLTGYIERSKSKGFHFWLFFNKPTEAVKLRLVIEMILSDCEIKCEIFPKQDEVTNEGFGNFINLPFFGGDIGSEKTIFVDEENKPTIKNVDGLNDVKVNDIALIDEIIEVNGLKREYIQGPLDSEQPSFRPITAKTPPCIDAIKENGVKAGQRNEAAFRLSIYYRQRNMPQDDVFSLLMMWNKKNTKPLTPIELKTIMLSVYTKNYKAFSCDDGVLSEYCSKKDCPIIQAHEQKKKIEEGIITLTYRDVEKNIMVFRKKDYEFRFTSFEFSRSGRFKVTLNLAKDKKFLCRNVIDLNVESHRKKFCKSAEDVSIEEDLVNLEAMIRQQIETEEKEKLLTPKQLYIMTEQEKEEATEYLETHPHYLSNVVEVTNRMGVVGEETLRLMIYLCFTSRIIDEPLSITVKGEASSGKSFACQNVMRLIPDEGIKFITRATQNAFYHLPEDGLQHKIIYINELPGSESADYSIRSAQSEGDLIIMMPRKDPVTGDQETITKRVKGPAGFLVTTTKANMFDENETRNFSVFSDDSPQLTDKIGDITVRKALGEIFKITEKEVNLWKNTQRLLNPDFKVLIPYAKEVFLSFPNKPVRIRRDRERFRVLIEIVTILHQYHREEIKDEEKGQMVLVSTLADYYIAKMIAGTILSHTIYETSPSSEQLWAAIKEMHANRDTGMPEEEFKFTYKDVARAIDWKVDKVKKWIYALTKVGLIDYAASAEGGGKGGRGKASIFSITKTGADFSTATLNFLPNISKLYDRYPCDKDLFYNPITGKAIDPLDAEAPDGLLDGLKMGQGIDDREEEETGEMAEATKWEE